MLNSSSRTFCWYSVKRKISWKLKYPTDFSFPDPRYATSVYVSESTVPNSRGTLFPLRIKDAMNISAKTGERNSLEIYQRTETSFKTEKSWGGNATPISKFACGFDLNL